jgi:hypothetical protein
MSKYDGIDSNKGGSHGAKAEGDDCPAVAAVSFILLIAFLLILSVMGTGSGAVASSTLIIFVIVWTVSSMAAIEYSERGWTIEGSTLGWIVTAIFAPFFALLLYFVSQRQKEGEAIDPDDHARLGRL